MYYKEISSESFDADGTVLYVLKVGNHQREFPSLSALVSFIEDWDTHFGFEFDKAYVYCLSISKPLNLENHG